MSLSARRAAVIAGLGLLTMAVLSPLAYFKIFPTLIDPTSAAHTVQNVAAHQGMFLTGIACYLVTFCCDVLVGWALYVLLRPVHASLSLLTAAWRFVYAAIGLSLLVNLVTVLRLVRIPDYGAAFGAAQLQAQVQLLVSAFRYGWGFSLIVFAIHLVMLGGLAYRSQFIPKFVGVLLVVCGLAYLVDSLRPYLFPAAQLPWLFVLFFGELIFMGWLLIRGPRLEQETA